MASPIPSGKQPVNLASNPAPGRPSSKLASSGPPGSRIRRDPPPAVKEKAVVLDAEEREQWALIGGVLTFALAIFFIIIAFASYGGWSPSQYTLEL